MSTKEKWSETLFILHETAAFLHLIQFIIMLALILRNASSYVTTVLAFRVVGTRTSHAAIYNWKDARHLEWRHFTLFSVDAAHLVCFVAGWTCIAHVAYAVLLQTGALKFGNPWRWLEYSVSASVMAVVIAQLSGCLTFAENLAVFSCTAATMLMGYFQEVSATLKNALIAFVSGCMLCAVTWTIILVPYFANIKHIPKFVHAIVWTLFVFFWGFAGVAVSALVFSTKRSLSWQAQELAYVCLSISSKSVLAWLVFSGTFKQ